MRGLAAVVFSPFLLVGVLAGSLTDIAYAQQPAEFREIARGVRVIRMWEVTGLRDPEIAVIEVTGEAHHEFHEDPFAFMNRYQIFPQALRPGGGGCLMALGRLPTADNGCIITASHDPKTSAYG